MPYRLTKDMLHSCSNQDCGQALPILEPSFPDQSVVVSIQSTWAARVVANLSHKRVLH